MALTIDRAGAERGTPGLLERLESDAETRALLISDGAVPLSEDGASLRLLPLGALRAALAAALPRALHATAFLGRDERGAGIVLVPLASASDVPQATTDVPQATTATTATTATNQAREVVDRLRPGRWSSLRMIVNTFAEGETDLAREALALWRWQLESAFCPACGTAAPLMNAGWARRCPGCGRQHFPRTDPAIIVAVEDERGERLLLGSNAAWPIGRFSCFAGFVDAGESAEQALVRELREEAGVTLESWRYIASQAWPYPRSLMLGYLAVARGAQPPRADGDEIVEVRWFTRPQLAAALAGGGDVVLPGPGSLSDLLISRWVRGGSERAA